MSRANSTVSSTESGTTPQQPHFAWSWVCRSYPTLWWVSVIFSWCRLSHRTFSYTWPATGSHSVLLGLGSDAGCCRGMFHLGLNSLLIQSVLWSLSGKCCLFGQDSKQMALSSLTTLQCKWSQALWRSRDFRDYNIFGLQICWLLQILEVFYLFL